ncbi:10033_t:CDS:2 [Paraglomus brasilianum]|uniref:10033_t:CDS:1 n=1 Tax=Paraglomus brasilianum TaxID=144538 RepID=A0A9N9D6J8_9GLOM|nr:10033_t:CDS:2 [Paraglomus brasilianum]
MAITITSIRAGEAWSERNLSNGCLDEFRQDFSAESSHIEPIFHHVGTTVDLSIDLMTYTLQYYPVAISNGDVIYDVQLNNVEEDNSADNWALFQVTNLRSPPDEITLRQILSDTHVNFEISAYDGASARIKICFRDNDMRSSIVSCLRNSPELIRLSSNGFDDWCPTDSLTVQLMCLMPPSDTDNDSHEEWVDERELVDQILPGGEQDSSEQGSSAGQLVRDPLILRTLSPGARYVDVRDHGNGCYGVIWSSDRSSFLHCINNLNALIKAVKAKCLDPLRAILWYRFQIAANSALKLCDAISAIRNSVGNAFFRLVFGDVGATLTPKIEALDNVITDLLDVLKHRNPEDYLDQALGKSSSNQIFERVIRCFNELGDQLKQTEESMKKFVKRQETVGLIGSTVEFAAVICVSGLATSLYKGWQTIGWKMKTAQVLGIFGSVGVVFLVNQLKEVAIICGKTVENVQLLQNTLGRLLQQAGEDFRLANNNGQAKVELLIAGLERFQLALRRQGEGFTRQ